MGVFVTYAETSYAGLEKNGPAARIEALDCSSAANQPEIPATSFATTLTHLLPAGPVKVTWRERFEQAHCEPS